MPNPIIPWVGGKRRLAKTILPLFPVHDCYVEPFAGGAALFFMKSPAECEVLNDINGELVNLYRVVQHHLEEFIRQFKWSLVSRQMYDWLKLTRIETLTDIQRAARFYYLQKMAFGGKVSNQTFGTATTGKPRLNLLRIEEELSAAHLRLARVFVEHLPWHDCIIALIAMTGHIRCFTLIHLIGRLKAMAWNLALETMNRWPRKQKPLRER